jgi:aspartyl aminopeptidase
MDAHLLRSEICRQQSQGLIDFIDQSPSPWHAANQAKSILLEQGFKPLFENQTWSAQWGGKYVVQRGASLIAFKLPPSPVKTPPFRIIGAHTDSPGLRLKAKPDIRADKLLQLHVEVYGSPILASFADRDLGLAGEVNIRQNNHTETRLVRFDDALLRLPNLAIHLNRDVNEQGLKFNKQTELPLIFANHIDSLTHNLREYVASAIQVHVEDILSAQFNVYDTQKGVLWGANQEFIANSQLDNLASCHAALQAIIQSPSPEAICMVSLFDHEEVGSQSCAGAAGDFMQTVINRIALALNMPSEDKWISLANSFLLSVDMAHAFHPNHPQAYDAGHHVHINHGPVIKTNVNQRYATNSRAAADVIALCKQADIPYQEYSHRNDIGCGSTIGPILAANLGVSCADIGSPMWAMHSLRESAGVLDHHYMIRLLTQFFRKS